MKLLKNISIFSVCIAVLMNHYLTNEQGVKEIASYQIAVFKDVYNTLIPIEIPVYSSDEESIILEVIQTMKSETFLSDGLYPVLDSNLEVEDVFIEDNVLYLQLNDSFLALDNQDGLDIAEALSYSLCNGGIEEIIISIEDTLLTYIPNSTIPISALTKSLGINNFETDTNALFRTIPVVVYNEQIIEDQTYYVPTTLRITCDQEDLDIQVQTILSKLDYPDIVLSSPVYLHDGLLDVSVDANVLLDNETIDETLYCQIIQSLMSIDGVEAVSIYIDGQLQEVTQNVSTSINNRVEI